MSRTLKISTPCNESDYQNHSLVDLSINSLIPSIYINYLNYTNNTLAIDIALLTYFNYICIPHQGIFRF